MQITAALPASWHSKWDGFSPNSDLMFILFEWICSLPTIVYIVVDVNVSKLTGAIHGFIEVPFSTIISGSNITSQRYAKVQGTKIRWKRSIVKLHKKNQRCWMKQLSTENVFFVWIDWLLHPVLKARWVCLSWEVSSHSHLPTLHWKSKRKIGPLQNAGPGSLEKITTYFFL